MLHFPLVPVIWRRSDAACLGAFVMRTGVELWRLAYLAPMPVAAFCRLAGLTVDELDRSVWARWLRSDAVGNVYGVRCSASDLFGRDVPAIERVKEAA